HVSPRTGGEHAFGEFNMGLLKTLAAEATLVEDADQVDHGGGTGEGSIEVGRVVRIAGTQFHARQQAQVAVVTGVAAEYTHRPAARDQRRHQLAADEAGTAQNDDGAVHDPLLGWLAVSAGAAHTTGRSGA